jgi:hypothetical protein
MDLSVSLSRTLLSLPDLDINDHTNYYIARIGDSQVNWRRQTVSSPWIDGTVTTHRSKENITRSMSVEVLGDTWQETKSNAKALIDAISQDNFVLTMGMEETTYPINTYYYTTDISDSLPNDTDTYYKITTEQALNGASTYEVNSGDSFPIYGYHARTDLGDPGVAYILGEIKAQISLRSNTVGSTNCTISGTIHRTLNNGDEILIDNFDNLVITNLTQNYKTYQMITSISTTMLNIDDALTFKLLITNDNVDPTEFRVSRPNTHYSVTLPPETEPNEISYYCEASDYSWVESKERWHSNRGILTVNLIHKPNPISGNI